MTTFTGKGINVFVLASLKYAVKLEAKGIKFKGRTSRTTVARRMLGLKPRATHAQVIAAIEEKLKLDVPIAQSEGGIQP